MLQKKTKVQNMWTLENVNKYQEYNTSESYIKSLIVAFENLPCCHHLNHDVACLGR